MTTDAAPPMTGLPGFLIRRLHQIHLALFAEECAGFDITPVQFSIMTVVSSDPGLDQTALAHEIGVDRATLANVLGRLETRGIVRRTKSKSNHRLKCVHITAAGIKILEAIRPAALRAHERTVEALPPDERAAFQAALRRLVDAGNAFGRAPLRLG